MSWSDAIEAAFGATGSLFGGKDGRNRDLKETQLVLGSQAAAMNQQAFAQNRGRYQSQMQNEWWNRYYARQQEARNRAQEERNAQQHLHAIQLRVEDAKRAGLHPLYALGAQVNMSPTHQVGVSSGGGFAGASSASLSPMGQSESGSHLGDAIRAGVAGYNAYKQGKAGAAARLQEKRLAAVQLAESAARTNLLNKQADAVALSARASALKSASTAANARQDAKQLESVFGSQPVQPHHRKASTWEDNFGGAVGDTVGFFNMLEETGKKLGKYLYETHKEYNRKFHDPYVEGP